MSVVSTSTQNGSLDALSNGGESLIGMAVLGKTAAALALVIAIILICTALLKRWGNHTTRHGAHLRIVGSTAVGNRERVVIVEVEDTWLVVGVGGGRITKLHERPAPENRTPTTPPPSSRFSRHLSKALTATRRSDSSAPSDPHQKP
ncbi:flagellar biosynthetic protein FliO [Halomonas sp. ISL-60]|uniref:flagellar biosynthetic protein FliO n=1 Tax=unclassified Halomonas TaxID=2609666 RepID=UPI001BE6C2CA|nr:MULTISPECIES: flagellar biosynthetic protein FliO [unclassified Halomonas]MBT2774224.1 flagellar biosynthetic protein FliO [Halomonas sp. ISL-60]MBT2785915.1 flagellar biosynthetic protein FliO [Halomonas sp. ISL-106]MBT2799205.1 flagellar biosynthetic protein FliO [Halomonas sp. ISL-104]MBT2800397.1 flagellar biosynthetic protein FliO [Halomonas sp. ISL-56]